MTLRNEGNERRTWLPGEAHVESTTLSVSFDEM